MNDNEKQITTSDYVNLLNEKEKLKKFNEHLLNKNDDLTIEINESDQEVINLKYMVKNLLKYITKEH